MKTKKERDFAIKNIIERIDEDIEKGKLVKNLRKTFEEMSIKKMEEGKAKKEEIEAFIKDENRYTQVLGQHLISDLYGVIVTLRMISSQKDKKSDKDFRKILFDDLMTYFMMTYEYSKDVLDY
jgi:hypothetical protein